MKKILDKLFGTFISLGVYLLVHFIVLLMRIQNLGKKKDFEKEICNLFGGAVFFWLMAEIYSESIKYCEQNNIGTVQNNQIED